MIDTDYILQRRIHKNQILRWKIVSLVLIAFLAFFYFKGSSKDSIILGNYIGSVLIDDVIVEDPKREENLERIIDDQEIKGLIVNINSPGGTAVGSEKLYYILRRIAETKPVVVVMGTMATSGGYMVSLGGDYIIAHNSTETGSIGVIMQSYEVTELAEKIGIKLENFKSGELKATPNPFEKVTPAMRVATMDSVNDTYQFFTELVSQRRQIDIEHVHRIADGRVYTGRQALKLNLVDAVGTTDDAVKWLKEIKKLDIKLKVKDIKLRPEPKITDIIFQDFGVKVMNMFYSNLQGLNLRI